MEDHFKTELASQSKLAVLYKVTEKLLIKKEIKEKLATSYIILFQKLTSLHTNKIQLKPLTIT